MKKRKRRAIPVMILWDRKQQQRFIEAVERLVSLVNDLEVLLAAPKRRREAALKANATRQLAAAVAGGAAAIAGRNGGEQ